MQWNQPRLPLPTQNDSRTSPGKFFWQELKLFTLVALLFLQLHMFLLSHTFNYSYFNFLSRNILHHTTVKHLRTLTAGGAIQI